MLVLGIDDGSQQVNGASRPGAQAAAAELDSALGQALVLAVQRQVIAELVDQHPGEEADIDHAFIEHVGRRRGGEDLFIVQPLVDRAMVFNDHIAAGTLGEPIGDLLADAHPLLGGKGLDLGVLYDDDLPRHVLAEAQAAVVDRRIAHLVAPLVGDRLGGLDGLRGGFHAQGGEQVTLYRRVYLQTLLGLTSKQLALEPLKLLLQVRVVGPQGGEIRAQLRVLPF